MDESKTHLWVVEVAGDRKARALFAAEPAREGGRVSAPTRSPPRGRPTARSVVFAAPENGDAGARAATPSHLWQVAGRGRRAETHLARGLGLRRAAVPSGRQRALCFTIADGKPAIYTLTRIGCATWPPTTLAAPSIVTKELDRAVGSWAFTPDSQTLYFTAEDAGHERIYAVPASGGAATIAIDAPQGVFTGLQIPPLAPVAGDAFANWESAVNPAEVVRVDPSSGTRNVPHVVHDREGASRSTGSRCASSGSPAATAAASTASSRCRPDFDESRRNIRCSC